MTEEERIAAEVAAEKKELGIPEEPSTTKAEDDEPKGTEVTLPSEEKEPSEKKEEAKAQPAGEEDSPKPFDFKEYKKELREKMQADFDQKLERMRAEGQKAAPSEEKSEDLQKELEDLAKELEFDPEKLGKLIAVARKGTVPSKEDSEYIVRLKEREAEREQEEIFSSEWSEVSRSLRSQFPNASEEQFKAARDQMEELAFSEEFHERELDYVLFRNKATFDKILYSPRQKTFETGRAAPAHEDAELPAATAENIMSMTPAQFEAYEKRLAAQDNGPREKVRITTRDDRGRMIDRYE